MRSDSAEFDEIRQFIQARRTEGLHGYCDFTIGYYLRRYSKEQLRQAEILRLLNNSYFEPCGEECGTVYETLCDECNWARQASDLVLDTRRVPQHKDISETIAWVEWVVSSRFAKVFDDSGLTGAQFRPIFEFKNPVKASRDWSQLWVTGKAGSLADATKLGRDPFSPSVLSWRCSRGHSVVAQFLSEVYLRRQAWDSSDVSITTELFGQGRNLLRPVPQIIISQRMYSALEKADLKGFSVEVAHLV